MENMETTALASKKTSMSVTEMRHLLGLKKTGSYWLLKKEYFKTIIVGGHIRILLDSFENWYQNQSHYKKVELSGKDGKNNGVNYQKKK